jgi:hypothetical protein
MITIQFKDKIDTFTFDKLNLNEATQIIRVIENSESLELISVTGTEEEMQRLESMKH